MLSSNISNAINSVNSLSKTALTLQLGQKINFTLVSQSKNFAVINIAGQKLTSQISTPLPENKPLQATVIQLKPDIRLEIKQASTNQPQNTLNQILKNLLPVQTPIKNEVQQLLNLQTSGKLPPAVQSQLANLIGTMLKINASLNGTDVRSAFTNSGLFLENKLFNGKTATKDFKANLFKLLGRLENIPAKTQTTESKQLQKSAIQLLNKVTIQQIQAIESHAINIELPVLSQNSSINLKMDIRKKEFDKSSIWEILTDLNLELGKMVVKSTYVNEKITFQIWADSQNLLTKIKHSIDYFKNLLEKNNIQYKNIFFSEQAPQVDHSAKKIALIDIKV